MYTKPDNVDEAALTAAISRWWGIDVAKIVYAPLGFGSHHWVASGPRGRWFVTVDDLTACLSGADDDHDAAFVRLESAFRSAHTLSHEGGLDFVVASILGLGGATLYRFDDRYSAVLHPFIEGTSAAATTAPTAATTTVLPSSASSPSCMRPPRSLTGSLRATTSPFRSAPGFRTL